MLASLLIAGVAVSTRVGCQRYPGMVAKSFAELAAGLAQLLCQAPLGRQSSAADWQALLPAAATLAHLRRDFPMPAAVARLTSWSTSHCGAGSGRGSREAPPDAQLHLPHLCALLGCGLQHLAACMALMRADSQLTAVCFCFQGISAVVHSQSTAACCKLPALAVLSVSCGVQAAARCSTASWCSCPSPLGWRWRYVAWQALH